MVCVLQMKFYFFSKILLFNAITVATNLFLADIDSLNQLLSIVST